MATATATTTANIGDLKSTEKPVSQWAIAWKRLRRHKLAMIGLVSFILIVIASVLAPVIAPYDYEEINLDQSYAPFMSPGEAGRPDHFLGTDKLGRDILSRLLYAGRISLVVALVVTVFSILIGATIGAISGSFGGATDTVLMRFTDIMLTLPLLPLLLILSSSLRQFVQLQDLLGSNLSVVIIIFVLVIFGWMGVARLVRGSVLSLRTQDFIEATRALGSSRSRIIFRHLMPNSMAPIIVAATLGFGGSSFWNRPCRSWASASCPRFPPGATCSTRRATRRWNTCSSRRSRPDL